MKNFIQEGANISVTAPAAIVSGASVLIGSLFGIAQGAAASGDVVTLKRQGVFEVLKVSAQAWAIGDKIYFITGSGLCTTTASGNKLIGVAVAVAADPTAEGRVVLDGAAR